MATPRRGAGLVAAGGRERRRDTAHSSSLPDRSSGGHRIPVTSGREAAAFCRAAGIGGEDDDALGISAVEKEEGGGREDVDAEAVLVRMEEMARSSLGWRGGATAEQRCSAGERGAQLGCGLNGGGAGRAVADAGEQAAAWAHRAEGMVRTRARRGHSGGEGAGGSEREAWRQEWRRDGEQVAR